MPKPIKDTTSKGGGKGKKNEDPTDQLDDTGSSINQILWNGETYVLTFNDEFNGSTVAYWTGHGKGGVWSTSYSPHLEDSRTNASNGELQYYVDPDMEGLPA